ncbi:MAG: 50S ribosomal protein L25 [Candidatus Pacebacteria bacterium]|nr:50S ribosomal protein L25 [Candidatus Paceibacterota bacterium]
MLTLKGELRDGKTKLAEMRKKGFIPAVYYGHKEKATSCAFSMNEFKKVWKTAGESTVISLEVPKGKLNALIYEVQMDPVRGEPIHADFYVIEKGQEVYVAVPIEFIGVAPAVKDLGANLIKVLHELEIKAQPENLPHNISVDLSSLVALDSKISAKDIKLPKGVTLVTNPGEVVVAVAEAKEEVIEEPVVDLSSIEVEKKGKKDEEGEGAIEGEAEKPAEKEKEKPSAKK